ncbi:MAG: CysE/LacA/LpxA/NodL family acetyltransferase [Variovorax sp.]|nr:CysE/LacA/LpxA/NodL family acetyltransferase [Variovorax sp.]
MPTNSTFAVSILDATLAKPLEGGPSFSLRHRIFRAVWGITWLCLAAWTPPPLHRWRRGVLQCFGAKLDRGARVYGSARIWYPPNLSMAAHACIGPGVHCYCMAPISLGERAIVSQRAHLCAGTHAIDDPDFQLVAKPIQIGPEAWIAAEAFVGPGVNIAAGSVVGARAVVLRDTEAWGVYTGNPAQCIKKRAFKRPTKSA